MSGAGRGLSSCRGSSAHFLLSPAGWDTVQVVFLGLDNCWSVSGGAEKVKALRGFLGGVGLAGSTVGKLVRHQALSRAPLSRASVSRAGPHTAHHTNMVQEIVSSMILII